MHRVAAIGSGTLDSLPHNGAVVTLLAVCGSTHRESYLDIVMVGIVSAPIALVAVIPLGSMFLPRYCKRKCEADGAAEHFQLLSGGLSQHHRRWRVSVMRTKVFRFVKITAALLGVSLLTFLAVRIYDTQRGLPLEPWHTHVPHELSREKLDAANWTEYLAAEAGIFDDVQREVSRKLDAAGRVPANRYFEGSPVYPGHFTQDFNRSFVLEPKGKPVGAVVLLHGLTDSPYSQRHIAGFYRDRGFVAVVPRMPAHGTVPAALTDVEWEDWMAATRLAVREARRRTEPSTPLHLVGFSNGGALALMYALDSIGDKNLSRPDRLVLI